MKMFGQLNMPEGEVISFSGSCNSRLQRFLQSKSNEKRTNDI